MADPVENRFLELLLDAVASIKEPRLFATERGYQGRLLSELNVRSPMLTVYAPNAIVEQEYQKTRSKHGLVSRPDVIIHIPHEYGFTRSRADGNLAVIQIKRRATKARARDDFTALRMLSEQLSYSLCVFLHIDSERTFVELCPDSIASRTHCIATLLDRGTLRVTHHSCAGVV
ncbi:MAG TPA: hypothetical protein VFI31_09535 [Pirellulales bacterium]|nr:hypothetical protein [Pirellulales bacterium]